MSQVRSVITTSTIIVVLSIFAFAPLVSALDTDRLEIYETQDAQPWYNPNAVDESSCSNDSTITISNGTNFTTIGPAIKVGASIFGGTWDGTSLKHDTGDDNGEGLLGKHAGHTMFAELSSPGTKDFAYLAKLLNPPTEYTSGWGRTSGFRPSSKFLLSYKGKSIVIEKRDVGGGGGAVKDKDTGKSYPRAIDIWYETAKLIDFSKGLDIMTIQQVADNTPVTPLGGAAATSLSDETSQKCNLSGGDSTIKDVVVYYQHEYPWKNQMYGKGTISACGCGPSSLAGIVSTFYPHKAVTPKQVADFFVANGGQMSSSCGSNWIWQAKSSIFRNTYGISITSVTPSAANAKKGLSEGGLVLLSVGSATPFTSGGHIMFIRGVTDSGNFLVGDSNSRTRSTKESGFTPDEFKFGNADGTRGMWIVKRAQSV